MNYEYVNNVWLCKICNREFKTRQATTSHIHRAHVNPNGVYGHKRKGTPANNKGVPMSEDQKKKISKSLKGRPGKSLTEETKQKLSKALSCNNNGGKCKWFLVNGQKVQGTWERDVAIKLDEMGVVWQKLYTNIHTIPYKLNNKLKHYTPDFYLPNENIYLEIKGYWWGNDKEKMNAVFDQHKDIRIVLIEKEQYQRIMLGELVW